MDFRANIIERLKPFSAYYCGDELASLIAIKGMPGQAELSGDPPFSGEDGLALDKSFGHLGWGFGSKSTRTWFGILLSPKNTPQLSAKDLKQICETVDPLTIVTLDKPAHIALKQAFTSAEKNISPDNFLGKAINYQGRQFVGVDNFEAALLDVSEKQRVWAQLKQAKFPGR